MVGKTGENKRKGEGRVNRRKHKRKLRWKGEGREESGRGRRDSGSGGREEK